MLSDKSEKALIELGRMLRDQRLERNDHQADFAARLGVSIPTLRKLEQGDPTVAIGTWVEALWLLGRLDDLKTVLAPKQSLFEQWEREQNMSRRKRASKKRAPVFSKNRATF